MQIHRVYRSKDGARKAYNRLSRFYNFLAGSSETPFIQEGLELLAVSRGATVLEIGPGTGNAMEKLASVVGTDGSVHGIDLSPGMLHRAHDRFSSTNVAAPVSLTEGDGACLPYRADSFDAVFISFSLELFDTPEIPVVLKEIHQVMKPGGRLGVVSMHRREHPGRIVRLYEWFHDHFPAYLDCRPINACSMLLEQGFLLANRTEGNMWGLPVELVVVKKK